MTYLKVAEKVLVMKIKDLTESGFPSPLKVRQGSIVDKEDLIRTINCYLTIIYIKFNIIHLYCV